MRSVISPISVSLTRIFQYRFSNGCLYLCGFNNLNNDVMVFSPGDSRDVMLFGERNGNRARRVADDRKPISGFKGDFGIAQKLFYTFVYPEYGDFIPGEPVSRKNFSHYFIRIKS